MKPSGPRPQRTRRDERFRLFIQDNPQPMWVIDRKSLRFLEINEAALKLYGYTRSEFLALRIEDLQLPEETPRVLEAVQHPQTALQPVECRHRLKNGNLVDIEISTHDIPYGRQHKAVLVVMINVTGRKQLEAQLLQSQKMEAVGMLAGGIAHDFNNLLTIISGYSQLLLSSLPPSDRNRSAVEQILKAGERAAALTRQLLAFSRRQTAQLKVLDLNLLVGSMAVMLRRLIGEDIDLRLELGSDLGQVSADPGQIEQVIMNLAVNSRDAMPKGGTLTIHTGNVDLDENYTGTHTRVKAGSYVMLSVSDTGVGMDDQTRSRLFEPFFTTKQQGRGTGLGLSIVFGIVRQAGGNVEVTSEPGVGTMVKIYLPRKAPQAVTAETEAPAARTERGTETILLVEDEEMVRKLVRETLEQEGYQILEAAGPGQAWKICAEYERPIQLMITDMVMPKESGRALAARLATIRPDMKVLYMSGYTDTEAFGAGGTPPDEFLQKPFTPTALVNKVRSVLKPANNDRCRHAGG